MQDSLAGEIFVLLFSKGDLFLYGSSKSAFRAQYKKILQAQLANTRKYWLVEVIENDFFVTQVGV